HADSSLLRVRLLNLSVFSLSLVQKSNRSPIDTIADHSKVGLILIYLVNLAIRERSLLDVI
ncbi:hypothetical protein, partial [Nostoc sp.]|uniref:hypothetical protein n=1 Tax=Nostoc sp. TaxID=1180 RepID=UPI002FF53004